MKVRFRGRLVFSFCLCFCTSMLLIPSSSGAQVPPQKKILPKPIQILRPTISTVDPDSIKIVQGGAAETVTVKGSNLTAISSVQVLLGGQVTLEVTAKLLDPRSATEQKVEFQASGNARIANDYAVRVLAGQQTYDVPAQVFGLEVISGGVRRAQRPPQAPTVSGLAALKRGKMRWSDVSMGPTDPNRPVNIPSTGGGRIIQLSPTTGTIRSDRFQTERRPAIPFKPFEILDPSKKEPTPIDPQTVFTLPNGESLTAKEYYDSLNAIEIELNKEGYSLDLRRDPSKNLGSSTTPALTGMTGASIKWDTSIENKIKSDHQEFNKLIATKTDKMLVTKKQTLPLTKEPLSKAVKTTAPAIDKGIGLKTSSKDYGPPQVYERTIIAPSFSAGNVDTFWVGTGAKSEYYGDIDKLKIYHEMSAEATIINTNWEIIRVQSNAEAPISGGKMTVKSTFYLAGYAIDFLNREQPVPSVPLSEMTDVPILEGVSPFAVPLFDASATYRFVVYCIPCAVKVGGKGAGYVMSSYALNPLGIRSAINPGVFTEAYGQAGIDIGIAGVYVGAKLKLLDVGVTSECKLTREFSSGESKIIRNALTRQLELTTFRPATHGISAEYSIWRQYNALKGDFYWYWFVYTPAWDWPPWTKHERRETLFRYCDGWGSQGYIVNPVSEHFTLARYPTGQIPGWEF